MGFRNPVIGIFRKKASAKARIIKQSLITFIELGLAEFGEDRFDWSVNLRIYHKCVSHLLIMKMDKILSNFLVPIRQVRG